MKKYAFIAVAAAAVAFFYLGASPSWAGGAAIIAIITFVMVKFGLSQTRPGRAMRVKNPFTGRLDKRKPSRPQNGRVDDEAPALIYVIAHRRLDAVKVGIGADPGDRVSQHESEGWRVVRVYTGMNRRTARQVEQAVLNHWKDRDIPYGADQWQLPQGGYTETAPLSVVHPTEICDMVENMLGIRRRRFMRTRRV